DVEKGFERAVEAALGDLLQHVVVEWPEHATAGFELVREAGAGRCGFLVTSAIEMAHPAETVNSSHADAGRYAHARVVSDFSPIIPMEMRPQSSVVRVPGPFAAAIRHTIGDIWIAPSYARAAEASRVAPCAVATMDGDLFRGPSLISGGSAGDGRGILETK